MNKGMVLWLLLVLASLLSAAGCGSTEQALTTQLPASPAQPQRPGTEQQAPAPLSDLLSSPAQMAQRSSSFTNDDGHRWASQYDSSLPNNRLSTDSDFAVYAPDFTAGSSGFNGLAYAIYSFTLPDYDGAPAGISLSWNSPPAEGDLWLALGNFTSDRWSFFSAEGNSSLQMDSLDDYINEGDRLLLAAIVSGTSEAELAEIQISGSVLPTALLTSDTDGGPAPLAVNFDGSGSSVENGSITDYEWDLDADGRFNEEGPETDARGIAQPAQYVYEAPGSFVVLMRVTSNAGLKDIAQLEINVASTANPPTAQLIATPDSGVKPLEFSLDASGSSDNGSITDYEWDFDNDGIYNEVPNDENFNRGDPTPPPFIFTQVGVYRMRVRVTDDSGDKDTAFADVTVNGFAPTADLFRRLGEGDAPMDAGFDATDSEDEDGTIVDYEWDFDGDGFFNEPDGEAEWRGNPEPGYKFPKGGVFNATVRVTDEDGLSDTDSELIIVHGWTFVPLDQGINDGGHFTQIINVSGKPAICHSSIADGRLRFGLSATNPGTAVEDWTFFDIDTLDNPGGSASMELVGGLPAIAYANSAGTGGFSYQRASGNGGASQGDWPGPLRLSSANEGSELSLAMIGGKPAIAFYAAGTQALRYAWSATASGAAAEDWEIITLQDDVSADIELGRHPSLSSISGSPALAFGTTVLDSGNPANNSHQLIFGRASTSQGSLAEDWTFEETFDVLGTNAQSQQHVLVDLGLNMPGIGFVGRNGLTDANRGFWFGMGIDNVTETIWFAELVAPAPGGEIIDPACIMFDDAPQVAFTRSDQQDPFVLRSFIGTAAGTPTWIQATNIREGGDPEGRYMDTMFMGETLTLVFRNETLQCPILAVRD